MSPWEAAEEEDGDEGVIFEDGEETEFYAPPDPHQYTNADGSVWGPPGRVTFPPRTIRTLPGQKNRSPSPPLRLRPTPTQVAASRPRSAVASILAAANAPPAVHSSFSPTRTSRPRSAATQSTPRRQPESESSGPRGLAVQGMHVRA
jgi:hypothetical protein